MLGLDIDGVTAMRPYSIASPSWDDTLEFFSIKVPDGKLTKHLQKIKAGDGILLGRKAVGTLVLDALSPGKTLYLFSTGTGFAPFSSIIRDPETYEKFDRVIVTHTCRTASELEYSKRTLEALSDHEFLGELTNDRIIYFDTVTRETHPRKGRITQFIETGSLFHSLKTSPLHPGNDRAMICGSTLMINETKRLLEATGLKEGSNSQPAQFVVEKSFVG